MIAGCVLLYLNPGDHQLMMDLLLFLIVGPAVISPLMELVEFGAELRNLSVRMDQIDDVLKMEPTGEGQIDAVPACPALSFRDVSFSYQKAADPLRRMALDHVSMEIPAGILCCETHAKRIKRMYGGEHETNTTDPAGFYAHKARPCRF